RSQSASVPRPRPVGAPALEHQMSISPTLAVISSMHRATAASSVTSRARWVPTPPSVAATAAAPAPSRSATTTAFAPSAAARSASAFPMPLAPPVTTTTAWLGVTMVAPRGRDWRQNKLTVIVVRHQVAGFEGGRMHHDDRWVEALYIGGEWVDPSSPQRIEVENPATEQVIGHVPAGQAADVDRAVAAAKEAFPRWSALSRAERADHLAALHEGLTKRRDEMAATITTEMGAPAGLAASIQVGLPLRVLDSYVQMLRQPEAPQRVGNSLVV